MTVKQKQCLLCYLGYYDGGIDGIRGSKTAAAEAAFGKDHGGFSPESLLAAVTRPEDFWQQIPNFRREEFRCKCGGKYCDGFPAEPSRKLVGLAQAVRSHFDAPVIISSGVRCERHNARVGGVSGSRHKTGCAMDFRVRGKTAEQVLAFVKAQSQTHYAYAIDENFLHMDVTEP